MTFFYDDKEIIKIMIGNLKNLHKETGTVIFVCGSICRGHFQSKKFKMRYFYTIKLKFKAYRWINDR